MLHVQARKNNICDLKIWIIFAPPTFYKSLSFHLFILFTQFTIFSNFLLHSKTGVHRCGLGGSMRACHTAGPGSILGRDKFPGWGFFRFFLTVRQMSGIFRLPRSPNIIWPSSIFIHYGRQWPEMLTHPKTSNSQVVK